MYMSDNLIRIIELNEITNELISDSNKFYSIRYLIIGNIDESGYKIVLERFRSIEIESHDFNEKKSKAVFGFFDYAIMHYALTLLKNLSYVYDIGEKEMPYNYLLAFQAGASRHIFISGEETKKRNLIKEFELKNVESNLYNDDKKITHFKFTKFESALDFAFKLQNTSLKFGFQRKKSDKLFSNLRTIYLGNVVSSPKDIFNIIWGGDVFQLKFLKEKNVAFLTFINPQSAEMFINYYSKNELSINDKPCRVMKGSVSNINLTNIMEIARGATRCLSVKKSNNEDINKSVNNIIEKVKKEYTLVAVDLNEGEDAIEIECLSIQDCVSIMEMFLENNIPNCDFMRDGCGFFNVFQGMLMC